MICECPLKNPDRDIVANCRERSPEGLICTRSRGHDGPHSACGMDVHPHQEWPQEDSDDA